MFGMGAVRTGRILYWPTALAVIWFTLFVWPDSFGPGLGISGQTIYPFVLADIGWRWRNSLHSLDMRASLASAVIDGDLAAQRSCRGF